MNDELNPVHYGLVLHDCLAAARRRTTLAERLMAAMRAARLHMVQDEPTQFAGAIGAVYDLSDDETKARIAAELAVVHELVNLGIGRNQGALEDALVLMKRECPHPIGLVRLWRETGPTALPDLLSP